MSDPFSVVSCSIEVYTLESGAYSIRSGDGLVRAVTVSKSLRGGSTGRFVVEMAPGGPNGVDSAPDWTEILTPGSHALIGMGRGSEAAIVMDGVITVSTEDQQWQTSAEGSSAVRSQAIVGADFAWFYNTQNWYMLAMQGLVLGTNIGNMLRFAPPSTAVSQNGLPSAMSKGLIGNGSPVKIGSAWWDIMSSTSIGILNSTFVPYGGGITRLPFGSVVGQNFEQYPDVFIPYTEQFLGLESWMSKFMDIFPWPWYEFFVTTAPSGVYSFIDLPSDGGATASLTPPSPGVDVSINVSVTANKNVVTSGTVFTMRDFPTALPAGPQMVARVTPSPRFDFVSRESVQNYVPGNMDMSRWNALPVRKMHEYGFFESRVEFSSEEAKNYYMLNPTAYQTMFGHSGSNVTPFPFIFAGAADPASVHRYGYRPVDATLRWMYDWNGLTAQQAQTSGSKINIVQTVATLTAALASWWHPLPLMARGQVQLPLSPSIYIGTRFEYAPFKDGVPWTFYIEAVEHRFVFGGRSSTTLTLSRGLPSSVYADSGSDGLLRAIYTGNARRQYVPGSSGIYQIGLPQGTGQGLQVFSSPTNAATLAQQMSQIFVTPQALGQ